MALFHIHSSNQLLFLHSSMNRQQWRNYLIAEQGSLNSQLQHGSPSNIDDMVYCLLPNKIFKVNHIQKHINIFQKFIVGSEQQTKNNTHNITFISLKPYPSTEIVYINVLAAFRHSILMFLKFLLCTMCNLHDCADSSCRK